MRDKLSRPKETRVAVFAPLYPPAFLGGGPIRTLAALMEQRPVGFDSVVIASDRDLGATEQLPVPHNEWVAETTGSVYFVSTNSIRKLARGFMQIRKSKPEIIYLNSFFTPIFSLVPQALGAVRFFRGAKVLIAPRGEFSVGALEIKSRKKSVYLAIYRLLRLQRRVVWHASTDDERADIQRVFGPSVPVLVRENETHLPARAARFAPISSGALNIVFVSRISEKKGLHRLLESLNGSEASLKLTVYGSPEDANYFDRCMALARNLPSSVTFKYKGWLDPSRVKDTFLNYDLFAFPTAGENFGHVIAEALSAGCPVMCPDNTPWTSLLKSHQAGVVVKSLKRSDWQRSLDDFARLSPEERSLRKKNAASAYEVWRNAPKGPHIFELMRGELLRPQNGN